MLCKVTHCAGHVSANTRLHQLHWGDREVGTAISCTLCMVVIQHNDISSCSLPQQKEFSLPNRAFLVSTCLPLTSMYVENIKVYILFKREDPNTLVNKTDTLWKHNMLSEHSHHPNYYSRINCYIYLTAYTHVSSLCVQCKPLPITRVSDMILSRHHFIEL